jgi:hypothetical protein
MPVSSHDRLRSSECARLSGNRDLSPREILQSSCNAMRRVKAHVYTVPLKIANLSIFIEMGIRSNQENVRTCAMCNVQGCARLFKIDGCRVAAVGAGAKYVLRNTTYESSLVEFRPNDRNRNRHDSVSCPAADAIARGQMVESGW